MPITIGSDGSITATGKGVNLYRMLAIKSGLKLELTGLRLTRGRSCYSIVKSEFGLRGNKRKVYEAFCKLCDAASADVIRVQETPGCVNPVSGSCVYAPLDDVCIHCGARLPSRKGVR